MEKKNSLLRRIIIHLNVSRGKLDLNAFRLIACFVVLLLSGTCVYKAYQWYITLLLQRMANEYYQNVHPGANIDRRYLTGLQRKESYLPNSDKRMNLTTLSEDPYIFLYNKFLSEDECSQLIAAGERVGLSPQVTESGKSPWRTSKGVSLSEEEDGSIVHRINKRVEDILGYNNSRESPELKRYTENEYYFSHNDAFNPLTRIATAVLILQNADEGGEFAFTNLRRKGKDVANSQIQKVTSMGDVEVLRRKHSKEHAQEKLSVLIENSELQELFYKKDHNSREDIDLNEIMKEVEKCENPDMKINTEVGDMIVFYYFSDKDPPSYCYNGNDACITFWLFGKVCFCDNEVMYDERLEHTVCPVYKGTKYSMTYWMRSTICNPSEKVGAFGQC